jgi:hypothetical protein
VIRAVVSGPFRRASVEVADAVAALRAAGAAVLSPEDPRIVDAFGDFVFVASDLSRTISVVEDRHLDAIRHADLLWIVSPDGYIGASTGFEIGAAVTQGVPVLSSHVPDCPMFRNHVTCVSDERRAVDHACRLGRRRQEPAQTLLLRPAEAAAAAREDLDLAERLLTARGTDPVGREPALDRALARLQRAVATPAAPQPRRLEAGNVAR